MSRLGDALGLYMRVNNIGTRQVGKETGMAHATVSRFIKGREIDQSNFMALLNWLLSEATQSNKGEAE